MQCVYVYVCVCVCETEVQEKRTEARPLTALAPLGEGVVMAVSIASADPSTHFDLLDLFNRTARQIVARVVVKEVHRAACRELANRWCFRSSSRVHRCGSCVRHRHFRTCVGVSVLGVGLFDGAVSAVVATAGPR